MRTLLRPVTGAPVTVAELALAAVDLSVTEAAGSRERGERVTVARFEEGSAAAGEAQMTHDRHPSWAPGS